MISLGSRTVAFFSCLGILAFFPLSVQASAVSPPDTTELTLKLVSTFLPQGKSYAKGEDVTVKYLVDRSGNPIPKKSRLGKQAISKGPLEAVAGESILIDGKWVRIDSVVTITRPGKGKNLALRRLLFFLSLNAIGFIGIMIFFIGLFQNFRFCLNCTTGNSSQEYSPLIWVGILFTFLGGLNARFWFDPIAKMGPLFHLVIE